MPDKVPVCWGVGAGTGAGLNSPVYLVEKSFLRAVISTPAFCFCRRQVPLSPTLCFVSPMVDFHLQFSRKAELLAFLPAPLLTPPPASQPGLLGSCGYKCPERGAFMSLLSEGKGPRVGGSQWGGVCYERRPLQPGQWLKACFLVLGSES